MKRSAQGFSLMELMIGITVMGVLLGLGVPAFRQFTQSNASTATNNDLVTSFQLARNEALKRNRPVTVCASKDGTACDATSDWISGWIAITDRGTAGKIDSDDVILQRWQAQAANLTITSDDSTAYVRFQPTGMTDAKATLDVAWDKCSGNRRRQITVLPSGTITSRLAACK